MSKTKYNIIKFILGRLCDNDFPQLCNLYLKDNGYDANLVPNSGRDWKHNIYDIYGYNKDKEPFIGHITIIQGTKKKSG